MTNFERNLLIHSRTKAQITSFLSRPAHALLLTGQVGSGKYSLAKAIAADLLKLDDTRQLDTYPYYLEITAPEGKQEIPIDNIRELIHKLGLKTPGKSTWRRIVIIDGAHSLSQEAQNALLKTLEEPALDTVFILTAPSVKAVAPTIASRAQLITVQPVTRSSAIDYYKNRHDEAAVGSNWLLSAGAAGLLDSLLKDDASHPLKDAVNNFKTFLGYDTFERLLYCDKLSRDKPSFVYFLDGGRRVLRALQQNSVKTSQAKQSEAIVKNRKLINSLQAKLATNTNPRLVALSLALNLKL